MRFSLRFSRLGKWWLSICVAFVAACGGSGDDTPAGGAPGGGGNPPAPTVQSVTVTPATATLEPGQTVTFAAAARDAAGNPVSGVSFAWSTSNGAVATINSDGVATGVSPGAVSIRATAAGVDSSAAALTVVAPGNANRSSEELIAAALAAGEIDAETALAYRVLAAFEDARLPARYRGNDSGVYSSTAVGDLQANFGTLSAATQDLLAPFLERPASVGSFLDPNLAVGAARAAAATGGSARAYATTPRPEEACRGVMGHWATFDPAGVPVRVWYDTREPGHYVLATTVAGYIEQTAWPILIGTLGFKPPLDDDKLVGCDGGDGRLDVYLVKTGRRGLTVGEQLPLYNRFASAAYILINVNGTPRELEHKIAHELAHAIHRGYPKAALHESYGWFNDAFANWAADQVTPKNPSINAQATCMFNSAHLPLDDRSKGHCGPAAGSGVERDYGAHLPLQFISKTRGSAMVRRIVEEQAGKSTALDAMASVLTMAVVWRDYALTLWNQDPIKTRADSFKTWDDLDDAPTLAPDLNQGNRVSATLTGVPEDETRLDARVANMSVKFYHFEFKGQDEDRTRSVMFHNTWYENKRNGQKVSVQAIYKPAGRPWVVDDEWTDYEWIGFCRDAKEQRIEELVIIVASAEHRLDNSTPVVQAAREPRLMRNNVGCWGFAGTVRRDYTNGSWSGGLTTTTAQARYETLPGGRPNQYTDIATGRLRVPIAAPLFTSAQLRYVDNHSESGCTYRTDVGVTDGSVVQGGNSAGTIVINTFLESLPDDIRAEQQQLTGTRSRAYIANGTSDRTVQGTATGSTECSGPYESGIGAWLLTRSTPATSAIVADDGHLRGTYPAHEAGDNYTDVYSWDLAPLRQP